MWRRRRFDIGSACLAFLLVGPLSAVHETGLSARVVKPDLSASAIRFGSAARADERMIHIHIENRGTEDAIGTQLFIVLPDEWSYRGSNSLGGLVLSRERLYGQEVVWNVPDLPVGGSEETDIRVQQPKTVVSGVSFVFSLTSRHAVPLFAHLKPDDGASQGQNLQPMSWWREMWERGVAAVRLWMKGVIEGTK